MDLPQIKFVPWSDLKTPLYEIGEEMYQNYKNRQLRPLQFYERKQMPNEIHYYDLPATQQHKCDTMLPSKIQCPTRAAISIVPNPDTNQGVSHVCRAHFELEKALNPNVKYVYHNSEGEVVSDVDKEYVPPQK